MSFYKDLIISATKCAPEDAEEIEDYMRDVIFCSTLDWQTKQQLSKAAKTAYKDILWMRSPAGQYHMKMFELQILNQEP